MTRSPRRLPRWAGPAVMVGVGLFGAVALLELLLRLAGLVAPSLLTRATRSAGDGIRVLCVGDSHTFGVMVAPEDAYPARLEQELRAAGLRASVVNRGVPGQNARQVRNRLPDDLLRYHPDVVLIWVGMNDSWNQDERDESGDGWRRWIPELRLVRFLRLLHRDLGQEGAVDGSRAELEAREPGGGFRWRQRRGEDLAPVIVRSAEHPLDMEATIRATADDLRAMVAQVRAAGAVPVLVTYPTDLFASEAPNIAAETVARETGTTLFDGRRITRELQHRGVSGLFFPDIHPTERFYRALARELVPSVRAAAAGSS